MSSGGAGDVGQAGPPEQADHRPAEQRRHHHRWPAQQPALLGPLSLEALSRIAPSSFLSIEGDTAKLNAAVVLTTGAVFDISGVKTLQLGRELAEQGVLPLHGQRPMTIKGVTVTSVGDDGQPLAANAPGRPYIVVAARGRFDASDSTLSDLGVQPIGADKGEPGISYNTDSTGARCAPPCCAVRQASSCPRRATCAWTATIAESWSDGLVLQADKGTRFSGSRPSATAPTASRSSARARTVRSRGSPRPATTRTASSQPLRTSWVRDHDHR